MYFPPVELTNTSSNVPLLLGLIIGLGLTFLLLTVLLGIIYWRAFRRRRRMRTEDPVRRERRLMDYLHRPTDVDVWDDEIGTGDEDAPAVRVGASLAGRGDLDPQDDQDQQQLHV